MENTSTPKWNTVRPRKVAVIVLAIGIAMVLVFVLSAWLYHPVMVRLHGGFWCYQASPDGHAEILYGEKACSN